MHSQEYGPGVQESVSGLEAYVREQILKVVAKAMACRYLLGDIKSHATLCFWKISGHLNTPFKDPQVSLFTF